MSVYLRFLHDKRASVAVTAALLISVTVGIAAIAVDVGTVFVDRRKAQNVADLAAIAAVSDLANAEKAAGATISRNKLSDTAFTLSYGTYSPDPSVAPSKRFASAASATADSARVTLTSSTPLYFGKALIGKDKFKITTTATATRTAFATFAIGSRLLKIDGGLLNQLLRRTPRREAVAVRDGLSGADQCADRRFQVHGRDGKPSSGDGRNLFVCP